MKGWMDDRADDEERQKGCEYERRKTLKERGRGLRGLQCFFFLSLHFFISFRFSVQVGFD